MAEISREDARKMAAAVQEFFRIALVKVELRWERQLNKAITAVRTECSANNSEMNYLREAEDRLQRRLNDEREQFAELEKRLEAIEVAHDVVPDGHGPSSLNKRLAVLERRA